ncbi:hypothetical protein H6G65_18585 [Microcystis elabens FACHB-917]|nr:hypothetical protein [Microcystis elabens FACHB-917]
MALAKGVLAELGVVQPLSLVFERLALLHQPEQRFCAGAQGGDEQMDVVKRLAVTPASAHQFDQPDGASPALTDGVCGIAGTEASAHLAAMAVVVIAYHHRQVPVAAEPGNDLLIQPALVAFDLAGSHPPAVPLHALRAPGREGRSPQDGFNALHQIFGHLPDHDLLAGKQEAPSQRTPLAGFLLAALGIAIPCIISALV